MSVRRLWWGEWHGRRCVSRLSMRRWVAVLLLVSALGLLLQLLLVLTQGPPSWLQGVRERFSSSLLPVANNNNHPINNLAHNLTQKRSDNYGASFSSSSTSSSTHTHAHAHHPYNFTLNEPRVCGPRTQLVMVVITAPNNTQERQAVRETWGRTSGSGSASGGGVAPGDGPVVAMVFLLGTTSDRAVQANLQKESRRYRDIVQEDFVDSYRNLSVKSVAMLKWTTLYCNSSQFVLKADDDMYINVTNLLRALRKEALSHSTFILGHVFTGAKPIHDKKSKWYTPLGQFAEKEYPRYTSGTAYAMTVSAARELYAASAKVPLFWLEDIYVTGLCSRKAQVPVLNHWGFTYRKPPVDGCHFRKPHPISGHRYSAEEIRTIFQKVNDPATKC